MNAAEILTLIQSARALYELGVTQYHLAAQQGRLTNDQKTAILAAASLSDPRVDAAVEIARTHLAAQDTPGS